MLIVFYIYGDRGAVHGVTLNNPSFDGAVDVRSVSDVPTGEYVSRTAGGWTFVGPSPVSKHATQAGLLRNDAHAMLIGRSGDQNARWAVDHSGAMHWGNGESDIFTSTLSSRQTTTTVWPVLTLHPGEAHGAHAPLPGVMPADICTCSHDGLGEVLVQLTCHVAKPGNIYIVRTCT
eukprot:COSAG02_NODE_19071_length_901_cov_1.948878_2_plen_175_part_01